ncbi:MAG: DUF2203 domain-containing protein [Melioribacteraceae bacterium]|nr:DUF2203 domain-containing protein [Melioribacteraceae bacterium]
MQTETKYFTPEEAVKTLPLVKKIVSDILSDASQIRTISSALASNIENNPEIIRLTENIKGYLEELEDVGCYFKDWNFQLGLVDFPSIIDDREVLLCWRSDEESIQFYHGVNEGYVGRKLIPEEYFKK